MLKIDRAQIEGEEWVETSIEMLNYIFPRGTGSAEYGHYKGIKVCEFGKRDEIERRINDPLYQRLHGHKEGKLEITR